MNAADAPCRNVASEVDKTNCFVAATKTSEADMTGIYIRILGTLSIDGKTVYMVSKEGYIDGTLIDVDTIESCYRHVNPQSAVIGCNLMKRQK